METIVRAVAKDHRQIFVCALVEVVAQFMMDRLEVLIRRLDAHLDAHVLHGINIPGARMTNDFAVTRLHEHRTLPEGLRQRREPDRCEKRSPALTISTGAILRRFRMSV